MTITREQADHLLDEMVSDEEAALILKVSAGHFRNLVAVGVAPQPLETGAECSLYSRRQIQSLADERYKAMAILQAQRDATKAKRKAAAAAKAGRAKVSA